MILFALRGFYLQAKETKTSLFKVMELLDSTRDRVKKQFPKIYSAELVEAIFALPFVSAVNLGKRLNVNYRTASRYLGALARGKILKDSYVGKYHVFANAPLLRLLRQ